MLTLSLVGGVALQLALQYRLNYWSRDFFDAFGRRDGPALRHQAMLFLALAGFSICVAVLLVWARMTIQRKWRAWLTTALLGRWLAGGVRHDLHFEAGEDDNSEFRIAEDARIATQTPVDLAASCLTALLSAVTFIGVLWHVGGDLVIRFGHNDLMVPKYLVITVCVYSMVLTGAMMFIGRGMVRVIEGKNGAEAEFRSAASHVREGTSTGRTADQRDDCDLVSVAFQTVSIHWRYLSHQVVRTTLVSTGNTLAAPIVAWVLCAPKYLAGTMSLGEAAQVVAAFVIVQTALNWLVDNYPNLAECLSSVHRVAALLQALDEVDAKPEGELAGVLSRPDE